MSRNQSRVDLYAKYLPRADRAGFTYWAAEWRWRMWKGSRIVASSSQGYTERRGAIENMETVLGGWYDTQYEELVRADIAGDSEEIPVRLLP